MEQTESAAENNPYEQTRLWTVVLECGISAVIAQTLKGVNNLIDGTGTIPAQAYCPRHAQTEAIIALNYTKNPDIDQYPAY